MFDRTTPGLYPERKQDLTKAAVTPTRKIPRRTITKRQSLTHRHQRQERHRRQEEAVPMEEWERTPHNHDNDDEGTSSMMMTATTGNLPVPHRSWCWVGSEGTTRRQRGLFRRGLFSSWEVQVGSRIVRVPEHSWFHFSPSQPREWWSGDGVLSSVDKGRYTVLFCGDERVFPHGADTIVGTTTKTATVRSGLR